MRLFIVVYVALGVVLSLAISIEYDCKGQEMFPIYYGSPVVFKQKSLGSSMEYFYSLFGLILNVAIWSVIIFIFNKGVQRLIEKSRNRRLIRISYKMITGLLIVFATLNMAATYVTLGHGFKKRRNYWYMDSDKEAKDWGMECDGQWKILIQ